MGAVLRRGRGSLARGQTSASRHAGPVGPGQEPLEIGGSLVRQPLFEVRHRSSGADRAGLVPGLTRFLHTTEARSAGPRGRRARQRSWGSAPKAWQRRPAPPACGRSSSRRGRARDYGRPTTEDFETTLRRLLEVIKTATGQRGGMLPLPSLRRAAKLTRNVRKYWVA